jgi:hypothetical protein
MVVSRSWCSINGFHDGQVIRKITLWLWCRSPSWFLFAASEPKEFLPADMPADVADCSERVFEIREVRDSGIP